MHGNRGNRRTAAALLWMCVAGSLAVPRARAAADALDAAWSADDTNCTTITSTRLTYDQARRTAVFDENVDVTDPQIHIKAERLTVHFTSDNKVATLEAESPSGVVLIEQADKKATSKKAVYDVQEGKVVLTGSPRVVSGRDILMGETITFWRHQGKILCEPKAILKLYSEKEWREKKP